MNQVFYVLRVVDPKHCIILSENSAEPYSVGQCTIVALLLAPAPYSPGALDSMAIDRTSF